MSSHVMPLPEQQAVHRRMTSSQIWNRLWQLYLLITIYILLGDLNARVGSRNGTDDPWDRVQGPHGYGETNDAGKDQLNFLSINETTVCNTWFRKKGIYKQTWQHPKSKHWHCIDSCHHAPTR